MAKKQIRRLEFSLKPPYPKETSQYSNLAGSCSPSRGMIRCVYFNTQQQTHLKLSLRVRIFGALFLSLAVPFSYTVTDTHQILQRRQYYANR